MNSVRARLCARAAASSRSLLLTVFSRNANRKAAFGKHPTQTTETAQPPAAGHSLDGAYDAKNGKKAETTRPRKKEKT